MDQALRKSGTTLVIVGLCVSALAPLAGALVESARIRGAAAPSSGFGTLIFLFGCVQIAKAKGQPWYYGLLGLLSCIGLGILWFVVPDKQAQR